MGRIQPRQSVGTSGSWSGWSSTVIQNATSQSEDEVFGSNHMWTFQLSFLNKPITSVLSKSNASPLPMSGRKCLPLQVWRCPNDYLESRHRCAVGSVQESTQSTSLQPPVFLGKYSRVVLGSSTTRLWGGKTTSILKAGPCTIEMRKLLEVHWFPLLPVGKSSLKLLSKRLLSRTVRQLGELQLCSLMNE